MLSPGPDSRKKAIAAIAAKYGIDVVAYLRLDKSLPMPGARTLIIFGKRLLDDKYGLDIYYHLSDDYDASLEMMALDLAALKTIERLNEDGLKGEEFAPRDMGAWAARAGLGWIGRSGLFISKEHGPRLRLKGILTDVDMGAPGIMPVYGCGDCDECLGACPVGAISRDGVDQKKCDACPLQHRKVLAYSYQNCMACTNACPFGSKKGRRIDKKTY